MTGTKTPAADGPLIHKAMLAIMGEIGAIEKSRKMQGSVSYSFRGIDQVYAAVHPLMIKHGVYMTAEVLHKSREERTAIKKDNYGEKTTITAFTSLRMRYHFVAADGSHVFTEAEGEGMDSGDKSSNKAMAIAHKYAILQAFCVPTEATDDPDAEVHEMQPRSAIPTAPVQPEFEPLELETASVAVTQAVEGAKNQAALDDIMKRNTRLLNAMRSTRPSHFTSVTEAATKRKQYFISQQQKAQ